MTLPADVARCPGFGDEDGWREVPVNDDAHPTERWRYMRAWAAKRVADKQACQTAHHATGQKI